ncbi:vanadium-dependent haloperoxidase [Phycicoccus sonneratiae]|uniref:Vanadium-dependent haloperoxidase n=1 Tax=Phycicoccus sonneratiae TaxID=2807628 RepID=A0ABS2CNY9_9MICO|nr:vanadium-dependent haloperoxidase [Phycicoccus sonneraticus]MBM6401599.1 vanadium-dependent haloperoxidase [Phycicoccus sonneraticus]
MSLPLPPPPDFATSGDAPYRREALEVYRRGAKLTSSEDQMVRWWADGPYMSASPVGHWMLLGVEAARAQGTDPARALAVLSSLAVVMHDAAVSCFAWKFRFGTMRPVTYIRKYMDSKWTPALTTPPFPEYPSGHSVISGAAATVLERWLPLKEPIQDVLRNPMNESAPRTVTSWTAAATEASKSRILAGLHYRSAVERGQELGVAIAGAAQ